MEIINIKTIVDKFKAQKIFVLLKQSSNNKTTNAAIKSDLEPE